jgi:hypothetical protein
MLFGSDTVDEEVDEYRMKRLQTYRVHKKTGLFTYFAALQSQKDLGRFRYGRFLKLFRYLVGLHGRVISPPQGLYLQRAEQHRKTRTNILALSGIRTQDPSV